MAEVMADRTKEDYDILLKDKNIQLPEGVLNQEVITLAHREDIIRDAKEILRDTENMVLKPIPRVPCHDIKSYLGWATEQRFKDITKKLFFKKSKKQLVAAESIGGQNCFKKEDEGKMLRFFLNEEMIEETPQYNVHCGFLTGRMDFLVELGDRKINERLVVECKSTRGAMVGKAFEKNEDCKADIVLDHKFSFQVQAYMYLLNKEAEEENLPETRRAAMVFLHYNTEEEKYGNYVDIDPEVQNQLEQLRLLCQTEVLARYLAVINLRSK